MLKKSVIKKILLAVAAAGLGFVLLNLTFLFDALFQNLVRAVVGSFSSADPNMFRYPPMMHILFVIIIGLISWLVFRSKLAVFWKATYLFVPAATGLVTIGMFLYRWPFAVFSLGTILCLGVLYYFHRAKQPWLYWYTLILISLVLVISWFLGAEI